MITADRMFELIRRLWPICRSVAGPGLRQSLQEIAREIPLAISETPTGTAVFDWAVPNEWTLRRATLADASGRVIVDTNVNNLHVVNYSIPFTGQMSLDALRPHLHTLPDRPAAIPYRTSYYVPKWGLCLAHDIARALPAGEYDVNIDTVITPGSLSIGECVIPGELDREVILSCHACHPMLANDNLASMAVLTELAKWLAEVPRRFTYRVVFLPGTIGSITWLATHSLMLKKIEHVLVCSNLGDAGPMHYKRTRNGDEAIDRIVVPLIANQGRQVRDFVPYGYDERQYSSPGVDLSAGLISRTPNGQYPEYHTSDDNLDLLRRESLTDSLQTLQHIIEQFERIGPQTRIVQPQIPTGDRWINTSPHGEPQLGRRGVYNGLGGGSKLPATDLAILWILNFSDGRHTVTQITQRSGIDSATMHQAHQALVDCGLLRLAGAGEVITPLSR